VRPWASLVYEFSSSLQYCLHFCAKHTLHVVYCIYRVKISPPLSCKHPRNISAWMWYTYNEGIYSRNNQTSPASGHRGATSAHGPLSFCPKGSTTHRRGVIRMERKQRQSVGDLITIQGAAQALGLTYWQTYRLVQKREVPTIKIGQTLMVRLSEVELAAR